MRTWTTWARLITNYNVYDDILRGYYESTSIDYRERWKEDIYRTMIYWSRAKIWEDLGNTSLQLKILLIVFSSVRYYHDIFSTKVLINEIFNFSNSKMTLILIIGMSWKAKMCDKGLLWRDSDVPWYCLTFLDIPWYSFIILDIPWCSLIFSRFLDILWYSLTFLQFDWDEQPYL